MNIKGTCNTSTTSLPSSFLLPFFVVFYSWENKEALHSSLVESMHSERYWWSWYPGMISYAFLFTYTCVFYLVNIVHNVLLKCETLLFIPQFVLDHHYYCELRGPSIKFCIIHSWNLVKTTFKFITIYLQLPVTTLSVFTTSSFKNTFACCLHVLYKTKLIARIYFKNTAGLATTPDTPFLIMLYLKKLFRGILSHSWFTNFCSRVIN